MRGDGLYWFLKRVLDLTIWGGELISDVELPPEGPAVFVGNHAGAVGPIGIAASLPVRLYPWVVGDMMDRRKAGAYLSKDFVKPELHLSDALATPVANALSKVTVSLLSNLGCIAVWHDRELLETLHLSAGVLANGGHLLIFPEDPQQAIKDSTGMRPFKTGFAHLGSLHFERTGRNLRFFPVAVHRRERWVQVAPAVVYNPRNAEAAERRRVASVLESIIAAMLAGSEGMAVGAHETP